MGKDVWTQEQLIIALNLYWQIPYNKISGSSNIMIKETSSLIGRTPGALAYKLMNFTSLDPERQGKGNKGKSGAGAGDKIIWNKYFNEWEKLANDSAKILSKIQDKPIEQILNFEEDLKFVEGKEKERFIKVRVNQNNFRQRILASYNEKCCITGLNIPSLLIASHIIPWSKNEQERLNPRNGLCLNSIHDKAFDKGLITLTTDYKIKLSNEILVQQKNISVQNFFLRYDNQSIYFQIDICPILIFTLALCKCIQKMNDIRILRTVEITTSRTLDILLVSSKNINNILYIYNYEGIHYRLFDCKKEVRKFFNCKSAVFIEFEKDESLDNYLLNYQK